MRYMIRHLSDKPIVIVTYLPEFQVVHETLVTHLEDMTDYWEGTIFRINDLRQSTMRYKEWLLSVVWEHAQTRHILYGRRYRHVLVINNLAWADPLVLPAFSDLPAAAAYAIQQLQHGVVEP